MFSDVGLKRGEWGTAFLYRGYKFVQIDPHIPVKDQIITLLHECFHHLDAECPRLEKVNGKWKFTGLKADWREPAIYYEESVCHVDNTRSLGAAPCYPEDDLFKVAPGLKIRYLSNLLSCVY